MHKNMHAHKSIRAKACKFVHQYEIKISVCICRRTNARVEIVFDDTENELNNEDTATKDEHF